MNYTIIRAGRTTHLKIVVVALVAGIAVVAVGINARTNHIATAKGPAEPIVVKATPPSNYAGGDNQTIR
jgi:hypothetical protein